MKVILSRKGFDSGIGGYASPILPDGTLLSLPIPEEGNNICYSHLKTQDGKSYMDIMKSINGKVKYGEKTWKDLNKDCTCHLDPDLRKEVIARHKNWKPIFGQVSAAQTHLENNGVKEDDLFLFFGWFRNTIKKNGKIEFDPKDKNGRHILYGYMQIGEKITVNKSTNLKQWMEYHPHIAGKHDRNSNNTIYIERENLSLNPSLAGAGIFNYDDSLVLTMKGGTRSQWQLPDVFKNVKITYHSDKSWKNENGIEYFQSVGRGQEFVIEENTEIEKWVKGIIEKNKLL